MRDCMVIYGSFFWVIFHSWIGFPLSGHDDEPAENPDEIEACDNDDDPGEFISMGGPKYTSNNSSFRSNKFSDAPSDM